MEREPAGAGRSREVARSLPRPASSPAPPAAPTCSGMRARGRSSVPTAARARRSPRSGSRCASGTSRRGAPPARHRLGSRAQDGALQPLRRHRDARPRRRRDLVRLLRHADGGRGAAEPRSRASRRGCCRSPSTSAPRCCVSATGSASSGSAPATSRRSRRSRPARRLRAVLDFRRRDPLDWSAEAGFTTRCRSRCNAAAGRSPSRRPARAGSIARTLDKAFDDVPVPASRGLTADATRGIEPFPTDRLVPYDPRYLSGFLAEEYGVDLPRPSARRASG